MWDWIAWSSVHGSLHSDISQADREDVLGFVDKNRNYRHGYCLAKVGGAV